MKDGKVHIFLSFFRVPHFGRVAVGACVWHRIVLLSILCSICFNVTPKIYHSNQSTSLSLKNFTKTVQIIKYEWQYAAVQAPCRQEAAVIYFVKHSTLDHQSFCLTFEEISGFLAQFCICN